MLVGSGGGGAYPPVGMSPAKAEPERAQARTAVAIKRFMDVVSFEI
jgi:hypothetical protein